MLDIFHRYAIRAEPRAKRMPQIVKPEVFDPSRL